MAERRVRGRWLGVVRGSLEVGAPYLYSGLLGPVMPRLFAHRYRRPDPWNYAGSPYEHRKYELKLELLRKASAGGLYSRVLEVGCGEGEFTASLASEGLAEEIVGFDVVPAALERAGERMADLPQVSLVQGNAAQELPQGPFDLVLASEIIYYLGPLRRVAAFAGKVLEVLAPGGCVLLLSAWPAARILHRPFSHCPELVLEAEHIERDTHRPYLIQIFRMPKARWR
ncbi:MAG: class I SAM-dependent methyltransferase [Candidatus Bipolaricaulota bacterium]